MIFTSDGGDGGDDGDGGRGDETSGIYGATTELQPQTGHSPLDPEASQGLPSGPLS